MLYESLKDAQKMVVGLKQTSRALEKGEVNSVYIAKDAEKHLLLPIIEQCKKEQIPLKEVASMTELGKACGIKVGAAVAAVLEK
jgi:large subunit ribosomal protein L7A